MRSEDGEGLFQADLDDLENIFNMMFDEWPEGANVSLHIEGYGFVTGEFSFGTLNFEHSNGCSRLRSLETDMVAQVKVNAMTVD